jgi:two-component system phosphate regulon sensor histidine kinase PhoR
VLLGILLSYGLARRHARAVKALSQAATQVAQGDFNLDLDAAQGAGLDALALSLSSMAGQLKDSFESLRAEQGLMDATLSGMEEAVLALDREGQVLLLNPAGERLLGLSLGEARGKPVIHAVRNSDLARLLSAAGKAPEQGVAGEMMVPGKPERHFSVTIHSLPPALGGAARTVVVLSDITELKRLLALRSEFAANVSHELKTPLTAIRAVLETLADGALEDPSVNRDFLAKALRHTERLSLLIDDILTLSGIEEKSRRGQVEAQGSCLVEEAYGQALGLVEGKAKARSIRVVAQLPQSLPQAAMNSGALCRVLVNLLDNAVKYSPEQGTVAFQARAAEGGLRLEVSDQGPGIAAGEQARLFERFYRPDKARSRDQGGTGLGLAIVKHLVEGVGGRVGVESALGKGSRFWVWLPEPKA